jgi:hypothetical protein
MADDKHAYRFNFFKDRIWMWALVLPLGFLVWLLPFILLWGLVGDGMEMGLSIVIALFMIGIPAYLVGWIFIYSYMEGVITRVTIAETEIRHRTPWLIFPLFWVTRKIPIEKIEEIATNIPYGMRIAIYLYYHEGKKKRKFYLPRFKNQPDYLEEFRTINARLPQPSDMLASIGVTRSDKDVKLDVLAAVRSKNPIIRFWNAFVRNLGIVFFLGIPLGSGAICLKLPLPGLEAFAIGTSLGFYCILPFSLVISRIDYFPILSQVLIWFFARKAINIVFWLVAAGGIQPDTLTLSASLNKFMQVLLFQPGYIFSLTDFLFWTIFILSILFSLDRIVHWLLRMKLPEKNKS